MAKEFNELIKIINEDMQRKMDADFKRFDLTFSQVRTLLLISKRSGEITQRDLEDELFISHSAIHGILKRLELKKLIQIDVHSVDKRNKIIYITELGIERLNKLKEDKEKDDPTSLLTIEERNTLINLLEKVVNLITK